MSKAGHSFITKEVAIVAFLVFTLTATVAQTQHPPETDNALRQFMRHYLGEPDASLEKEWPTRYSESFVDLKDDGKQEVIVYVSGRGRCGSGGCVMLILAPKGDSYRALTKTTVTRLPIRVLTTKSNGWHDISVWVAGGGIQPGYEAELSFDGKTYPSNPTVPPARRLRGDVKGRTVIAESTKDQAVY